jgi:hypothetical protein
MDVDLVARQRPRRPGDEVEERVGANVDLAEVTKQRASYASSGSSFARASRR